MDKQKTTQSRFLINFNSIQIRLILSSILIGIAMAFLLVYALSQARNSLIKGLYIRNEIQPARIEAFDLNSKINQTDALLQSYLLYRLENFKIQRIDIWKNDIPGILNALSKRHEEWKGIEERLVYTNLVNNVEKLQKLQETIEEIIDGSLIDLNENNNELNPKYILKEKVQPLILSINRDIQKLNILLDQYQTRLSDELQAEVYQFIIYVGIFLLSILIFIVVITYNLSAKILNSIDVVKGYANSLRAGNIPRFNVNTNDEMMTVINDLETLSINMQKIKKFSQDVGQGNFESEISVFENEGEIGKSLAEMRVGLVSVAIQNRQRNWANEGIALFSNILRSTENTAELYDNFINNLVKYTNANQGGVFIINYEDKNDIFLESVALYAFERKRFEHLEVRKGQGLIGQIWRERNFLYLEEVPENYIKIVSGFGEASPKSILIVPIIINDEEFLGAIELAFFRKLETYEIDYIKRIAEILASLVSSIKKAEESDKLLSESRLVAEKMRLQEEQMKKNLDELESTQKTMLKKQIELDVQTNAVNTALATIEFDLNGIILTANEIFLHKLKYDSLDEIKNKPHSIFVSPREVKSAEYEQLWENLRRGISKTGEFKRIAKDGTEVWLNATYTTAKDMEGNFTKVIELATEITDQKKLSIDYQGQFNAVNKSNAVIEFTMGGIIINANDTYLDLLGYKLEDIKGKYHSVLANENEEEINVIKELWIKLNKGEYVAGRFKRITKSGAEIWIRGSYNVIEDLDGVPIKVVNYAQDITEAVLIEKSLNQEIELLKGENQETAKEKDKLKDEIAKIMEELKEYKQTNERFEQHYTEIEEKSRKLENIISTSVYPVVVIDQWGFIDMVNRATEKMFGYASEELVGNNVSILMDDYDRTGHDRHLANYKKTNKKNIIGKAREVDAKKKSGVVFKTELAVSEIRVIDETFFVGFFREIKT